MIGALQLLMETLLLPYEKASGMTTSGRAEVGPAVPRLESLRPAREKEKCAIAAKSSPVGRRCSRSRSG